MFVTISKVINWGILAAFALCFSYQLIYFVIRFRKKEPEGFREGSQARALNSYPRVAVLIAARNEEAVIGDLLDSLNRQTYPELLMDVYVVADNCTDWTASIARAKGATCFERRNTKQVGKGYALQYLLDRMSECERMEDYDAYFVFDADNILRENYIEEMVRVFNQGYEVVTSYRNSKNFGDNWISFGYGLWFLHESELLNKGRMAFGSSCMVSGTGYMFSEHIRKQNGGWNFFLLTEDIEFTADCITKGIRMGYCHRAEFFDEQPTSLKASFHQRIRWIKGYYQVFHKYGRKLARKAFVERKFSAYDMLMGYLPAFVLTAIASMHGLVQLVVGNLIAQDMGYTVFSIGVFSLSTFATMYLVGAYTLVSQWKQIGCPTGKKLLYLMLFPIYMYTYFPIAIAALKRKVEWKPMVHGGDGRKKRHEKRKPIGPGARRISL